MQVAELDEEGIPLLSYFNVADLQEEVVESIEDNCHRSFAVRVLIVAKGPLVVLLSVGANRVIPVGGVEHIGFINDGQIESCFKLAKSELGLDDGLGIGLAADGDRADLEAQQLHDLVYESRLRLC